MRARDQLPPHVFAICVTTTFAGSDCGRAARLRAFWLAVRKEIEERMRAVLAQQASHTNGVHRYERRISSWMR